MFAKKTAIWILNQLAALQRISHFGRDMYVFLESDEFRLDFKSIYRSFSDDVDMLKSNSQIT